MRRGRVLERTGLVLTACWPGTGRGSGKPEKRRANVLTDPGFSGRVTLLSILSPGAVLVAVPPRCS